MVQAKRRSYTSHIVTSAAVLAGACIAIFLTPLPDERHLSRFRPAEMIGLTEAQVLERYGLPHGKMDDGSVWNYQISKSPGAVVIFAGGKVVEVTVWSNFRGHMFKLALMASLFFVWLVACSWLRWQERRSEN